MSYPLIMKPGGHGTARVLGHTAIIDNGISACTCRQWNGPRRSDDETYGEYTTRAYDAHKAHQANVNNQPEQAPGGLFAEQQELFS